MASHEVLQAFVQAATQGSFSAAARKLGKSQSTVSAAVASLEIDLNVVLFDRSSRKPTLTPAGKCCCNGQNRCWKPVAAWSWQPVSYRKAWSRS